MELSTPAKNNSNANIDQLFRQLGKSYPPGFSSGIAKGVRTIDADKGLARPRHSAPPSCDIRQISRLCEPAGKGNARIAAMEQRAYELAHPSNSIVIGDPFCSFTVSGTGDSRRSMSPVNAFIVNVDQFLRRDQQLIKPFGHVGEQSLLAI